MKSLMIQGYTAQCIIMMDIAQIMTQRKNVITALQQEGIPEYKQRYSNGLKIKMKKLSLKNKILYRLKELDCWVHKGRIEARAKEWGYLGETAGRRCREMASGTISNEKTCPIVLEVKEENGSVWYRYKPQETKKIIPLFTKQGTVRLLETITMK